jgi:hypothetical protein
VDLAGRKVLESVAVGNDLSVYVREIVRTRDRLLVTTRGSGACEVPSGHTVNAIDLSVSPLRVAVSDLGCSSAGLAAALPQAGLLALATGSNFGPVSMSLGLASTARPLAYRWLPEPPSNVFGSDVEYTAVVEDQDGFWALHPCCDWDGGGGALLHFSLAHWTWRELGSFGHGGPHALAVARDGLVHEVYLAFDGVPCGGCPTPTIDVLDVATASFTSLPGGWSPLALKALTVP